MIKSSVSLQVRECCMWTGLRKKTPKTWVVLGDLGSNWVYIGGRGGGAKATLRQTGLSRSSPRQSEVSIERNGRKDCQNRRNSTPNEPKPDLPGTTDCQN